MSSKLAIPFNCKIPPIQTVIYKVSEKYHIKKETGFIFLTVSLMFVL